MPIHAVADAPLDDRALAARVAARDAGAFETLMRLHNRRLFRAARAILRSDADAEDAVQDAYVAAWRNIGAYRGEARLSTWLTRIVVNEAYARLRRQSAARVVALDDAAAGALADPAMERDGSPAPDHEALRAELRALLERHIDRLPEQFRTVFVLRDIEELAVEEVAAALDIPEATVRTRAFRARALLRGALSQEIDAATLEAFGFAGERCNRIVAHVLAIIAADPPGGPSVNPVHPGERP